MRNLIPYFISKQYEESKKNKLAIKQNQTEGKFRGISVFVDISGFTNITQTLMKNGKEGAEIMSNLINAVFTPSVDIVYKNGGFVTHFAGDAFASVFPEENNYILKTLASVMEIKKIFKEQAKFRTRFGVFNFSVKIGLSFGAVQWGIIFNNNQNIYYFKGEAVDNSAICEKYCDKNEIIFDDSIYQFVENKNIIFKNKAKGYYSLNSLEKIILGRKKIKCIKQKIQKDFYPEKILKLKESGEFREVITCFISFEINSTFCDKLSQIVDLVHQYNGYFNNVNFGDKGAFLLIFFGAPIAIENTHQHACEFVLATQKIENFSTRIGLTIGIAFTGFRGSSKRAEYISSGTKVNLAARLMSIAKPGETLIDKDLKNRIKDKYLNKYSGKRKLKGFEEKISIYKITGKKSKFIKKTFKRKMIGRDYEIKNLLKYIDPIKQGKFSGIVYIYGEAGIGKSSLINELTDNLKPKIDTYILQSDNILKKTMNPFVFLFKQYFNQSINMTKMENKSRFNRKYINLLTSLENIKDNRNKETITELKKIKSYIAALLDYQWKNSLYEKSEPKMRFENTLFAIKTFVKGLCLLNPVVLILEDLHFLDRDSHKVFQTLTRNIKDYPLIIISTSRFNDDGTKPELQIDKDIDYKEIVIKNFNNELTETFIKNILKNSPDKKLTLLINKKTQGNPFFIEQFCLYLKENDMLKLSPESNLIFYDQKNQKNFEIPNRINSIIISRIDRLSDNLKETIQIASVIGREFNIKLLLSLINLYDSVLSGKDFKLLIKNGVDELILDSLTEIKYIFKHALLHEAIYEMQLRENLRTLHNLAGECIEQLYKRKRSIYPDLAYHFEKGENIKKAKEYLLKAGDLSKEKYDNENAISFYDRLLKYTTEKEEKIIINMKKGEIFELIGKWTEAEKIHKKNIKWSTEIKKIKLIAENKKIYGLLLYRKGKYDKSLSFSKSAKLLYSELNDISGESKVIGNMGLVHFYKGVYDKAIKDFKLMLKINEDLGDKILISNAYGDIGRVHSTKGEYLKAMRYYKKQLNILEELGYKKGICIVLSNMGNIYQNTSKYKKAMDCHRKALKISKKLGDRSEIGRIIGNLGILYFYKSKYHKALNYFKNQLNICEELGYKKIKSNTIGNIGAVYRLKGEFEKAMKYYKNQLNINKNIGYKKGIGISYANIGGIYYKKGNFKEAMKYYKKKLILDDFSSNKREISIVYSNIGEIYMETRYYKKAENYFNKAIKLARELKIQYYLCSFLYNKALLLYKTKKNEESKSFNEEALKISKEIKREDIIFKCKILKIKILKNKEKAIKKLTKMQKKYKKNSQIAILNYELYKITDSNKFRIDALKLFEKLYKITPDFEYKNKIKELKNR